MKRRYLKNSGFTLAELIIAMSVMSIIVTAVATLSFALGSANDSAEDTSEFQSKIRFSSMYITDIIKKCNLICANRGDEIVIWTGDKNNNGQINPDEVMYIENIDDCLKILEYDCPDWMLTYDLTLLSLNNGSAKVWLNIHATKKYTTLIDKCAYMVISTDVTPPYTNNVTISIGIKNDTTGVTNNYMISSTLRCRADCLLDSLGQIVSDDDM